MNRTVVIFSSLSSKPPGLPLHHFWFLVAKSLQTSWANVSLICIKFNFFFSHVPGQYCSTSYSTLAWEVICLTFDRKLTLVNFFLQCTVCLSSEFPLLCLSKCRQNAKCNWAAHFPFLDQNNLRYSSVHCTQSKSGLCKEIGLSFHKCISHRSISQNGNYFNNGNIINHQAP